MTDPTRLRQILMQPRRQCHQVHRSRRRAVSSRVGPDSQGEQQVAVRRDRYGHRHVAGTELVPLFQPFSQADASTSAALAARGWGLAISKRSGEDAWRAMLAVTSKSGKAAPSA